MNEKTKQLITSITPKYDKSWYIKWVSSFFIIMGMILTSLDVSLFPLNLFFHLVGVIGWFVVGMLWHDRALIMLNGALTLVLVMGLLKAYFGA